MCERYGTFHIGYCDANSACDTRIERCADASVGPTVAHVTCPTAACVRRTACQAGDPLAAATVESICLFNEASSACASLLCTQLVAGWNGAHCEKYQSDLPGFCNQASACVSGLSACSAVIDRTPLFTCRSMECRASCRPNSSNDAVQFDDVCLQNGEAGGTHESAAVSLICRQPVHRACVAVLVVRVCTRPRVA